MRETRERVLFYAERVICALMAGRMLYVAFEYALSQMAFPAGVSFAAGIFFSFLSIMRESP